MQARGEPVDPEQPFVLSVEAAGGPRIIAANEAAEAIGLAIGDRLADARARVGGLQIRPADDAADAAACRRLALWCSRYTPSVALWGEEDGADGLFLDATGTTHLFGGEEALLADLAARLRRFGLPARLALADTHGAGWALARFSGRRTLLIRSGEEAQALQGLPIEALRLSGEVRTKLRRLGFKRIGDLMHQPRAPFTARFGRDLLHRLDQMLGREPEPVTLLTEPPAYHAVRQLLEPIGTHEAVVAVATQLMKDLSPMLERDGVGARALRLLLYRVDSEIMSLDIGLAQATRNPDHVGRLVRLKLEHSAGSIDAGFGFETVRLHVLAAERLAERQAELTELASAAAGHAERLTALVDVFRHRLGARSVRRLWPRESHIPERAVRAQPFDAEAPVWPMRDDAPLRPLLLLIPAEPAEVIALVPEGPPRRFRWRGATHHVAHAQGPERIAAEWWRDRNLRPTRDYYMVEDEAGRRFWIFREGLYGRETTEPRWFLHGLFA